MPYLPTFFGKFGKTNIGPTYLWLELFQRLLCSVLKRCSDVVNDIVHIRAYHSYRLYVGYMFRFDQAFQPLRSYQQTEPDC